MSDDANDPPSYEHDDDDPVEIPIEDYLDLHSFQPSEVRMVVEEYLVAAQKNGFQQVRLIHGKGTGAQKRSVQALLATLSMVVSYHDDRTGGGNWGATIVYLSPSAAAER